MIRRLVVRVIIVATLTAVLGFAAYGLLAVGLKRATADDRLVARTLRVLESTRGGGAVMSLNGRTLLATCQTAHVGSATVSLDDGTRLILWRTHVARIGGKNERELLAPDPRDLPSAEANLAGSHDLYSRELTATLLSGGVGVRPTRLGRQLVYALRLGLGSPLVELYVARSTLRPVAARYVSRTSSGTSQLIPFLSLPRLRPTGC